MSTTIEPVPPHPVQVLLEDPDPLRRSRAHLALGRKAMAQEELEIATEHFRAAADLDPTDERPRSYLRGLGGVRRRRTFLDLIRGR